MLWKTSDKLPLTPKIALQRLDRVTGDLNVLLTAVAIGLATLDMTCFVSQRLVDNLPKATRIAYADAPTVTLSTTSDAEPPR
jgi:hypothetical protein